MRGAGAVLEQMEAAHVGQVRVFDAEVWTGWVSQGWVARHLGCLPRDASQGCVPGGEASRCGGECVGMGWVWGGGKARLGRQAIHRESGRAAKGSCTGRHLLGPQINLREAAALAVMCTQGFGRKLDSPGLAPCGKASLIRLASPRAARQA